MHPSWQDFLQSEFSKDYFQELSAFLHQAYSEKTIFPPKVQVFKAFTTDLDQVHVIIIGQDPYHTPGVANGLAFSVNPDQKLPPSLQNIYKEIDQDIGKHQNPNGNLTPWQEQGVLLLNNVLTVEAHKAASHRGKGWEVFTEAVIKYLNKHSEHLVFLLWGRDAQTKEALIDTQKHLILKASHPSPFSAHSGFFGCKHFSKCNQQLRKWGYPEISW